MNQRLYSLSMNAKTLRHLNSSHRFEQTGTLNLEFQITSDKSLIVAFRPFINLAHSVSHSFDTSCLLFQWS